MKIICRVPFTFCFAFFLLLTGIIPTFAATDSPATPSLTLQYQHDNIGFADLSVRTYRIAETIANGSYILTDTFDDYPVSIQGIRSQTEWNAIASTLASYIAADDLTATCFGVTDQTGTVSFENILPGIYLTLSVTAKSDSGIAVFPAFLTAIPSPETEGSYNCHITVKPKHEYTPITPVDPVDPIDPITPNPIEKVNYRVIKEWKDTGYTQKRPESVTVDILKDGIVQSTQILSAENNWSYSWTAEKDGSQWQAVEKNVPADYTVTITGNQTAIIIINTHKQDDNVPKTGDTTVIWPYALGMCLSGCGMILVSLQFKRRKQ